MFTLYIKYRASGIYPRDCCEGYIHTCTHPQSVILRPDADYAPTHFGRKPYLIYFHVRCGESSKRHWEQYDDINPLSEPLFQALDSNWSSHGSHILGGGKVHSSLCVKVLLVGATVSDAVGRREGGKDSRPVRGVPLCQCPASWAPQGTYVAAIFKSAHQSQYYAFSQVTPWGSGYCLIDAAGTASPCWCWLCHRS